MGFDWPSSFRDCHPTSTPGAEKVSRSFTVVNLPTNQAISRKNTKWEISVTDREWVRQTTKIMMILLKLVTKDLFLPVSNGF